MPTRMIVIRHGETYPNLKDMVSGGNDDPALTVDGLGQALDASVKLRGRVDHVVSSPKRRCKDTGTLGFGLAIPRNHRLTELNERYYGRFDSGPNDAWKAYMNSLKPTLDALSEEERRNYDLGPGIENEAQVIKRALGVLSCIGSAKENDGKTIGVSTSGGIIRGALLGCGYELPTGAIDNLAQLEIDYDDQNLHVVSTTGVHFDK